MTFINSKIIIFILILLNSYSQTMNNFSNNNDNNSTNLKSNEFKSEDKSNKIKLIEKLENLCVENNSSQVWF